MFIKGYPIWTLDWYLDAWKIHQGPPETPFILKLMLISCKVKIIFTSLRFHFHRSFVNRRKSTSCQESKLFGDHYGLEESLALTFLKGETFCPMVWLSEDYEWHFLLWNQRFTYTTWNFHFSLNVPIIWHLLATEMWLSSPLRLFSVGLFEGTATISELTGVHYGNLCFNIIQRDVEKFCIKHIFFFT